MAAEKSIENYSDLINHWKKIEILRSTVGLLQWDLETYMPVGSIDLRQEQLSQAAQLEHDWLNDTRFKEAVLSDKVTPQNDFQKRNLELWKKGILISSSLDAKFVDKFSRASSECNMKWRSARANSNFKEVLDLFKTVVELSREQLQRIKENPGLKSYYANKALYDVAFDQYEPGLPFQEMHSLLTKLCEGTQKRLPAFLETVKAKPTPHKVDASQITKDFCQNLMRDLGFNFNKGRLDASTHPFCGGYSGDIRITVRTASKDPIEDLFSTLHEVGHALYDQGLPAETVFEPAGKHCSMGVHESQSRFIENFIGRSRAFSEYLSKKLNTESSNLYALLNPIKLHYIRVDSDEVTYNLHILLRTEIERDLMEEKLDAKDLPERWNTRFKELTGLEVDKDSNGCLQDTHWYSGAFGYFPSYSLGNMFAAELFQDFKNKFPEWETSIKNGELKFVRNFMAEKVYPQAAKYDSPACMQKVIGRKVSEGALLNYFDAKFSR